METVSVNNGSGDITSYYCPSLVSTSSQVVVTPITNTIFILYKGAGTDTVRVNKQYVPIDATYTFGLPINSANTTYTLRSDINCNNPKTNIFTLTLAPTLSITATQNGLPVTGAVCPGSTVSLTAIGATAGEIYYLRNSSGTLLDQNQTGVFNVNPTTSTIYSITTKTDNCGGADVVQRIAVDTNNLTLTSDDPDNNVAPLTPVILTAGGGTAGAYSWTASDGTVITSSGSQVTVYPKTSTQYTVSGNTAAGNCPTSASIIITVNGVILPVEFASFTAIWVGKAPQLNWATASEKSSASFVVERSMDGLTFAAIGQRAGAGNTTTRTEYQFSDVSLSTSMAGTVYYRLRQVNTDGTFSYSAIKTLQVATSRINFKASVYPNPSARVVTVEVEALGAEAITCTVHDALGKQMLTRTVTASGAGLQEISLPEAASLRAGIYYLTVRQGTQQQVLKLSRK
ncbi:T9SS type A sorting domain-containing protein [Hymenobacter sp. DG25A]|uniref:T9SS type A sorting domain-containing protein n=1 Tax=Hymenobacter sp. DG25A TaxID=1385663 RepID=UPI0006C88FC4|nr:T9SS type A sorting domain-containing protein [Hymenobacter sp. DG25A]